MLHNQSGSFRFFDFVPSIDAATDALAFQSADVKMDIIIFTFYR